MLEAEELSQRPRVALEKIPGISVAVLFGSRAEGRPHAESDLDIALLPGIDLQEPRRKLQARVASLLGELVPEGKVDVVFLDEAPELLRQRILEKGVVLIQRDPQRWKEIRRTTMREHGDREPYRRLMRLGQMRRLLEKDTGHGRRDALSSRLAALESYLGEIRVLGKSSREDFVSSPALHHLAERYLHLACECILDIVHHIIADSGYRQAASYRDAMEVLREASLLDQALADRLKEWMGLRDTLVHFYLAIDHGRVHEAITEDLDELQEFARRIAPLLGGP